MPARQGIRGCRQPPQVRDDHTRHLRQDRQSPGPLPAAGPAPTRARRDDPIRQPVQARQLPHLAVHLGNPETTLVEADRWIVPDERFNQARGRRPDLLVAFGVDPAAYEASNGYIVSEQRKPPDFVLEVASESTAEVDLNEKRDYYVLIGVGEYWRFDRTGEHHGEPLAGERLVKGEYFAIEIEELPGGDLQGYSAALDLHLRWERGELVFCDPATGRRIVTLEDERARADSEREARVAAEVRADTAEAERDAERQARQAVEARVRELEARLGDTERQ